MDNDGQRYLSDMRRASRDDSFLRWASHMSETASLPLMGYVWEQDGRIIGNASLIPFRRQGETHLSDCERGDPSGLPPTRHRARPHRTRDETGS